MSGEYYANFYDAALLRHNLAEPQMQAPCRETPEKTSRAEPSVVEENPPGMRASEGTSRRARR